MTKINVTHCEGCGLELPEIEGPRHPYETLNFKKSGHNLGYHNQLIMFPLSGDGIVIIANSENGEYVINYLISLIAQKYHWLCYFQYLELIIISKKACLAIAS